MLDFFVLMNLLKSTLIPYPLYPTPYIYSLRTFVYVYQIYILWESTNNSEQGRSTTLWHARSIQFPRPYHHLTSNFKLYPISHLKPTGTYTGQLTLPYRIYCPNFSLYMSFRTEHCWEKLCLTEAGECKNNALISLCFYFFSISYWRTVAESGAPHQVTVKRGPRLRDWERSTQIRNTIPTLSIRASA
jgi:hypothetical protein